MEVRCAEYRNLQSWMYTRPVAGLARQRCAPHTLTSSATTSMSTSPPGAITCFNCTNVLLKGAPTLLVSTHALLSRLAQRYRRNSFQIVARPALRPRKKLLMTFSVQTFKSPPCHPPGDEGGRDFAWRTTNPLVPVQSTTTSAELQPFREKST
ncbi:hypothetical protein BOTBODRAFT_210346 [Botryobasidium botryosum FD-172 SS1]|uniref:Uncharacterized protein n=1 Tax=Botryobasidium botryosum (strain FD-172 SS1) TaxID=930990 RepID=A0A067N1D8_BOTB1|nr:hypothetical protein BOTBODRAFT_210346 [Botryobasidium botryosum FD-172 SS1]